MNPLIFAAPKGEGWCGNVFKTTQEFLENNVPMQSG